MPHLSVRIPNVSESLEERLEQLLLAGCFWPDQPLASERRLAEEFDVSRTTVRTALGQLTTLGLLQRQHRRHALNPAFSNHLRCAFVQAGATPTALLQSWSLFFEEVIQLCRSKALPRDEVAIQRAKDALRHEIGQGTAETAGAAFHALCQAICNGCYNLFVSQTCEAFLAHLAPVIQQQLTATLPGLDARQRLKDSLHDPGITWSCGEFADLLWTQEPAAEVPPPQALTRPDPATLQAFLRSEAALEALYELRLLIEGQTAKLAARRIKAPQKKALVAVLSEMSLLVEQPPADYGRLDIQLHHLIAEAGNVPGFCILNSALAPVLEQATARWLGKHHALNDSQTAIHLQHEALVEAILSGQAKPAYRAMRRHLVFVLQTLRALRERQKLQQLADARQLLALP